MCTRHVVPGGTTRDTSILQHPRPVGREGVDATSNVLPRRAREVLEMEMALSYPSSDLMIALSDPILRGRL